MEKLKVFEAFSGYGSQSIALRNINVPYEVVAISEIDEYAIRAYEAIHGKVNNLGDISKIKVQDIPKHDLFTYSFPCQDISVSGKGLGLDKKSGTRSGLLWECEKIIEHCKPKYLLMENVMNLLSEKHKPNFDKWCEYLTSLGYSNYYKILNAKDYGIPQSRKRIFMISILGEHKPYKFPDKLKLTKQLKDLLENNVDKKYYLSEEIQKKFTPIINKKINKEEIIKLGNTSKNPKSQAGTVISDQGVSMTICAGTHGYAMGYIFNGAIRGRYNSNKKTEQKLELRNDNISNTVTTVQKDNIVIEKGKIRRFTPRECFRLQGLSENDIDKIQNKNISDTQQYKMAGNSIPVDVLEYIFKNLFVS